jgi:hypothetical protein
MAAGLDVQPFYVGFFRPCRLSILSHLSEERAASNFFLFLAVFELDNYRKLGYHWDYRPALGGERDATAKSAVRATPQRDGAIRRFVVDS